MLTNQSTGKDWKEAALQERMAYIEAGCRRCVELGLNPISPSMVADGVSEYYRFHEKFHDDLEEAFGAITSAIFQFGDYRKLTSKWS